MLFLNIISVLCALWGTIGFETEKRLFSCILFLCVLLPCFTGEKMHIFLIEVQNHVCKNNHLFFAFFPLFFLYTGPLPYLFQCGFFFISVCVCVFVVLIVVWFGYLGGKKWSCLVCVLVYCECVRVLLFFHVNVILIHLKIYHCMTREFCVL